MPRVLNTEELKSVFPDLELPEFSNFKSIDSSKEIVVLTNGDLRKSANQACWEVQDSFEKKLNKVLQQNFGISTIRAHRYNNEEGHGFLGSQRDGSDAFMGIDPEASVIVLLTAWQYSHHVAPSLLKHKGPILILANFDGTWPGLVGALNLEGSLTSLGREYSRLWSVDFDDDFFYSKLEEFLAKGIIKHDVSYLKDVFDEQELFDSEAGQLGKYLGEHTLHKKEIIGLFDSFCMGMINGVFPQKALCDIGMPFEGLSQSMLLFEMSKVSLELREECLQWYIDKGMDFKFGENHETDLTREQVLEQCAMLIAMARVTDRFGLSCIGVQYQQGLKDSCAASDFAEGAIGSTDRFPIPDENGQIIRPGKPIPNANEVDMGSAIPQLMLFKTLETLGLNSETTLHDIRWGSEYEGMFYWDFEISGNVPFGHIKGGIAGSTGYRQPAMYFAKGGSTLSGQCKAGTFVWARAHYEGTKVHLHVGSGNAIELPDAEFQRRLDQTTDVWPLMNVTLDGISRDQLMAGHQSNHITVAYVPVDNVDFIVKTITAMGITQGMQVKLAGQQ